MEVTAWNNGEHRPTGAGYGFKISAQDRNKYFQRAWSLVYVALPGEPKEVEVNTSKRSFWSETCRELISREFGRWLIKHGFVPWTSGKPPKFRLLSMQGNRFRLERP